MVVPGPTSPSRTLSAPSNPELLERHACDVRLRLPYLQYGHSGDEPSETLRDRCSRQECRYSLRKETGTCRRLNCWNRAGLPASKEKSCPRLHIWKADRLCSLSQTIANIANLHSFVEGPWKTHQALLLTLPRTPRRFLTWSLVASPMKFPHIDRNAVSASWSEFIHQSESFHFQPPDIPLPSYLDPDPILSQKLALKYKRWSSASEKFLMSKCDAEMPSQKKFFG